MKAQSILSRILLPIDISEGSRGAAGFCSSLAKALGPSLSRMTLLYVNPVGHFSRHVGYVDFRSEEVTHDEQFLRMRAEHIRRDIMPLMEETAATLRAAAPGLQVDQMVVDGDPAHEIARVAEDGGYSTIVIATRNLPDLKRLFLGSVTRKVIGYSHCDVLAVPPGARFGTAKIIVPTDGSPYSAAAASKAMGLAKFFGSQVVALSVSPSGPETSLDLAEAELPADLVAEEGEKEAEGFVRAAKEIGTHEGVEVTGVVTSGAPYSAIVDFAKERDADLIVIGSHGRTGLDKLLMGSVAERVVTMAHCAVLVVKAAS
jgi:nucleotide-binding universal stress UspA family protein